MKTTAVWGSGAVLAMIAGCASNPLIPAPLQITHASASVSEQAIAKDAYKETPVTQAIPPLEIKKASTKAPVDAQPAIDPNEKADISVNMVGARLPEFIQTAYGTILKMNVSIDPQVAARNDLVSFTTGKDQTPTQFARAVKEVLRSYGLHVNVVAGLVRVTPENVTSGFNPEIMRGRALPETPLPLRPVFYLAELGSLRTASVSGILRQMFGNRLQIVDDPERNALLLSGQSSEITAALEAIEVLDQPNMRSQKSVRISPQNWGVEDLAKKLSDMLAAEGYNVASQVSQGSPFPILVLPVPQVNSLFIFATDDVVLKRAQQWAVELDRQGGSGSGYMAYTAKYADAAELAKTIQALQEAAPTPGQKGPTKVVVNAPTNTLIFPGGSEDFTRWKMLMKELDRPSKTVMIEVIVAEVTESLARNLGVDWTAYGQNGTAVAKGLAGAATAVTGGGAQGMIVNYLKNGEARMTIGALAGSEGSRVLSNPRIVTRNGENATFQVGQEIAVPVASLSAGGIAGATVTNTYQYRSTGVIFKVKPIVHAGDRVDLDVSQEVSAANTTSVGVGGAPTFQTKKIETKLSVRDSNTVLLGGLISSNDNESDAGVPWLKDVPLLGNLFKLDKKAKQRTELLVLITPYVINDDDEALQITQAFRARLGGWAGEAGNVMATPAGKKIDASATSDKVEPRGVEK
ncbi:hypothetical protein KSF73_03295 [Burkholderiaceae bacterium DAT-1]|nr:hypothetical protein [Burkholderiaceae bacterium DAT-1]